jgi:hypothetical protein
MIKKLLQTTLIAIAILPQVSFADIHQKLDAFFQEKISGFEGKLSSLDEGKQTPVFPAMTLSDINVQVEATVSFGIASVLDLSISPEVDFIVTPAAAP